jgi:hypothetical protein
VNIRVFQHRADGVKIEFNGSQGTRLNGFDDMMIHHVAELGHHLRLEQRNLGGVAKMRSGSERSNVTRGLPTMSDAAKHPGEIAVGENSPRGPASRTNSHVMPGHSAGDERARNFSSSGSK